MVDTFTHLKRAAYLSKLMDNKFSFGPLKFGLDPIIGLLPLIGDWLPVLLSIYMIWIGHHMGMPKYLITKMVGYTLIDFFIGTIPIFGDVADFIYKSHIKNLAVLMQYQSDIN